MVRPARQANLSARVKTERARRLAGRRLARGVGIAFAVLPAMLLPFLSALLLFGGSFIVLTRVMLLSVRAVVVVTMAEARPR